MKWSQLISHSAVALLLAAGLTVAAEESNAAPNEPNNPVVEPGAVLRAWQLPDDYAWNTPLATPAEMTGIVDETAGWSQRTLRDSGEFDLVARSGDVMMQWTGWLEIETPGAWTFELSGLKNRAYGYYGCLVIQDQTAIQIAGGGEFSADGSYEVELQQGWLPITLYYASQHPTPTAFRFSCTPPGAEQAVAITPAELFHPVVD